MPSLFRVSRETGFLTRLGLDSDFVAYNPRVGFFSFWTFSLAEQLSHSTRGTGANVTISLIVTISSGSSFQRRQAGGWKREAVGKNVLLWSAVFEDGIATAAVWCDADALAAIRATGEGGNVPLSRVAVEPTLAKDWHPKLLSSTDSRRTTNVGPMLKSQAILPCNGCLSTTKFDPNLPSYCPAIRYGCRRIQPTLSQCWHLKLLPCNGYRRTTNVGPMLAS